MDGPSTRTFFTPVRVTPEVLAMSFGKNFITYPERTLIVGENVQEALIEVSELLHTCRQYYHFIHLLVAVNLRILTTMRQLSEYYTHQQNPQMAERMISNALELAEDWLVHCTQVLADPDEKWDAHHLKAAKLTKKMSFNFCENHSPDFSALLDRVLVTINEMKYEPLSMRQQQ